MASNIDKNTDLGKQLIQNRNDAVVESGICSFLTTVAIANAASPQAGYVAMGAAALFAFFEASELCHLGSAVRDLVKFKRGGYENV